VLLSNTIAYDPISCCSMNPINTWAMFPNNIHSFSFHSNLCPPNLVLNYSISKWVNWVLKCFMNLYPLPKCNVCYLRIIVVTLIQ
jgi:hypothetical protein